jgi:hypothetical protein
MAELRIVSAALHLSGKDVERMADELWWYENFTIDEF